MTHPKPVLLVDLDSMIYAAAGAAQMTEYALVSGSIPEDGGSATSRLFTTWGEANKARAQYVGISPPRIFSRPIVLPLEHAVHELTQRLNWLLGQYPEHQHEVYVSGYGNYREVLAHRIRYKWNRIEAAKPQHFGALRKYAIDDLGARMVHWCEPDDVLATRARELRESAVFHVIASIDKDLDQVPGMHHNFSDGSAVHIDPTSALLWFYTQVMAGDSTDGVPGAKGISLFKAERRVAQVAAQTGAAEAPLWAAAVKAYADMGHTDPYADALETARLVWLCDTAPVRHDCAARPHVLDMPAVPLWCPPEARQ